MSDHASDDDYDLLVSYLLRPANPNGRFMRVVCTFQSLEGQEHYGKLTLFGLDLRRSAVRKP